MSTATATPGRKATLRTIAADTLERYKRFVVASAGGGEMDPATVREALALSGRSIEQLDRDIERVAERIRVSGELAEARTAKAKVAEAKLAEQKASDALAVKLAEAKVAMKPFRLALAETHTLYQNLRAEARAEGEVCLRLFGSCDRGLVERLTELHRQRSALDHQREQLAKSIDETRRLHRTLELWATPELQKRYSYAPQVPAPAWHPGYPNQIGMRPLSRAERAAAEKWLAGRDEQTREWEVELAAIPGKRQILQAEIDRLSEARLDPANFEPV